MSSPIQLAKLQKRKIGNPVSNWQKVYQQLELNKIDNVTSYQVNNNLFIVVPLED